MGRSGYWAAAGPRPAIRSTSTVRTLNAIRSIWGPPRAQRCGILTRLTRPGRPPMIPATCPPVAALHSRKRRQSMDRRSFLATTAAGAAALSFPTVLRAQSKDPLRIGFPLPLTGPFGALAADQQSGATLAMDELNAKGGVLGRKVEVLFRDDQLKPAVGAQRTKELIENDKVQFVVGGLAAHVQMAINEQTKKAKVLFISVSQSDEISAKPDTSPLTFHEALNPTITSRAVGTWIAQNLGKRWWIVYADYAWGKQNNAVLTETLAKQGGTLLGSTPYPLGSAEFSPHLKEGGGELYGDVYSGTSFYWELEDSVPSAKKYVEMYRKKYNAPPGDYGAYAYSGVMEVARGCTLAKSVDSETVADALRKNPVYDHYKGKQWWRNCDNKSFQDLWITRGREPGKVKGEWGFVDIVAKIPANEELDRTCKEKGHA